MALTLQSQESADASATLVDSRTSPGLSGVWPFEKEFVSIYRQMVQVTATLHDLPAEGDRVRVSVSHSLEYFDLIVESLSHCRCQPRCNVSFDFLTVPTDRFGKRQKWFKF